MNVERLKCASQSLQLILLNLKLVGGQEGDLESTVQGLIDQIDEACAEDNLDGRLSMLLESLESLAGRLPQPLQAILPIDLPQGTSAR